MAFTDRLAKAFDYVSDLAKQLITLSTGILAITITFSKDFLDNTDSWPRGLFTASWIIYILAIFFGIWTLMALAGSLEPPGGIAANAADPSTRGTNVTLPFKLQLFMFLVATCLVIAAGVISLRSPAPAKSDQAPASAGSSTVGSASISS